ncbi:MAG: endonuclease/exonuclease/phosphatase family protein [Planctomycetes bacterium]|nr:endonuclease/exonuclease/phosphatase family protein [Planctomycetota bacterium]
MRLLSWNIHKGIGGIDRRYDIERTLDVLSHYDADVLLLQEVDRGVPRSRGHHQAEHVAERLGHAHVAFGPNVRLKQGVYGNAIVSRHPLLETRRIDLTFPLKKVRGALLAKLELPVGEHRLTLHLVNVHLGLSGIERRWQVQRLLDHPQLRHLDARSRLVIAGDTNDWTGALPRGRLARDGFECVTGRRTKALRTFPSWRPVGALDRVFVRGPLRCAHLVRPRLPLAVAASDHLPVVLDLELLPGDGHG